MQAKQEAALTQLAVDLADRYRIECALGAVPGQNRVGMTIRAHEAPMSVPA